jgi:hypothetical protein
LLASGDPFTKIPLTVFCRAILMISLLSAGNASRVIWVFRRGAQAPAEEK